MNRIRAWLVIPLLLLFAGNASAVDGATPVAADDGFDPAIFAAVLILMCVLLVLLGIGVGFTIIMAGCAAVLAALGIVSSSMVVGLVRRRFSSGLRAFHYQVLAAAGLPAGLGALWFGAQLFHIHLRQRQVFAIGSTAGVCAGLLLAYMLDSVARIACRRIFTPAISHE